MLARPRSSALGQIDGGKVLAGEARTANIAATCCRDQYSRDGVRE